MGDTFDASGFTGTLSLLALYALFTGFTRTRVQILTPRTASQALGVGALFTLIELQLRRVFIEPE